MGKLNKDICKELHTYTVLYYDEIDFNSGFGSSMVMAFSVTTREECSAWACKQTFVIGE